MNVQVFPKIYSQIMKRRKWKNKGAFITNAVVLHPCRVFHVSYSWNDDVCARRFVTDIKGCAKVYVYAYSMESIYKLVHSYFVYARFFIFFVYLFLFCWRFLPKKPLLYLTKTKNISLRPLAVFFSNTFCKRLSDEYNLVNMLLGKTQKTSIHDNAHTHIAAYIS